MNQDVAYQQVVNRMMDLLTEKSRLYKDGTAWKSVYTELIQDLIQITYDETYSKEVKE